MKFRVDLSSRAEADLRKYFKRAQRDAPRTAERWWYKIKGAILSLASFPHRCGLAPEDELVAFEVRQLIFGRDRGAFRILFTIDDEIVRILLVRRGSQDIATADDLFGGEES